MNLSSDEDSINNQAPRIYTLRELVSSTSSDESLSENEIDHNQANIRDTRVNVDSSLSDNEESDYEYQNEQDPDESKSPCENALVNKLERTASISVLENSLESTKLEECIICLDKGQRKLVKNFLCDCVFYYHPECYAEWIVSNKSEDISKCLVCKKPFNINHNLLDKEDVAYILSFDRHLMSTYDLCCSDLKHNVIVNCRNLVALIAFLMLGTIFFIILSTYS